jgi:HEAT repeat protein
MSKTNWGQNVSVILAMAAIAAMLGPARLAATPQESIAGAEAVPAGELIRTLKSDAALRDKLLACQQLAVLGDPQAVPVLAELLDDEQLSHAARYALEPIDDAGVDQALRDAMSRLRGSLRAGVITSLGQRGDEDSVEALGACLLDADLQVASAAGAALGQIGTAAAAQVLQQALMEAEGDRRVSVADACLACADRLLERDQAGPALALYKQLRAADLPPHVKLAAISAAITASGADGVSLIVESLRSPDEGLFRAGLGAIRDVTPAAPVAQALLNELPRLAEPRRALALLALADLGAAEADSVLRESAGSGAPEVRVAAIEGIRKRNVTDAVPLLLTALSDTNERIQAAARQCLVQLQGRGVDEAILEGLRDASGSARARLIEVAGRRRMGEATPAFVEASRAGSPQVRQAAILALGETVSLEQLSTLVSSLAATRDEADRKTTVQALEAACLRMDREACAKKLVDDLGSASTAERATLLELLAAVGGQTALDAVARAARDANTEIQDAATRVLGDWMSPAAAPVLLQVARGNGPFRIRALRGYLRIARQLQLTPEERLEMCEAALDIADREQERDLIREIATRVRRRAEDEGVTARAQRVMEAARPTGN